MTTSIEEALRSGAWHDYDAGLLNDFGGGNVDWWQDYLRAEIGRTNDFWRSQISSPDPALVALIEERDRFRAALTKIDAIRNSIIGFQNVGWSDHIYPLVAALHEAGFEGQGYKEASTEIRTMLAAERQAEAAEARALAAEAKCDALREALKKAEAAISWALGEGDSDFGDNRPENAKPFWWRTELRERARALTQETNDVGE